jgi:hypothetical protein
MATITEVAEDIYRVNAELPGTASPPGRLAHLHTECR